MSISNLLARWRSRTIMTHSKVFSAILDSEPFGACIFRASATRQTKNGGTNQTRLTCPCSLSRNRFACL